MSVSQVEAVARARDDGCVEACDAGEIGLGSSKDIGESSLNGCGVVAAATAEGQISVYID